MPIQDIAIRVSGTRLAKEIIPPPNMYRSYMDFAKSYIGYFVLDTLFKKNGLTFGAGSKMSALSKEDRAIATLGMSMMEVEVDSTNMAPIPLDLTGWREFSNLKVPFSVEWVEEVDKSHNDLSRLEGLVNEYYPGITKDRVKEFFATKWFKPLYFGGVGNMPALGAYFPDMGYILLNLSQIEKAVLNFQGATFFEHGILRSITATLHHEFVHFMQKVRDAIVSLDHEFGLASGTSQGRTKKSLNISDTGSTWQTEPESQICMGALKDKSLFLKVFDSTPPAAIAGHLGQFLKDREFKSRSTELAKINMDSWNIRHMLEDISPAAMKDADKFADERTSLVDTVFQWAIQHAKSDSFKKRVTKKYERMKKEAKQEFLRKI